MNRIESVGFVVSVLMILSSCGGATHNLGSGNFSNSNRYKVNSYYGCCGCYAKYFTFYKRNRKVKQIVYDYSCPKNNMPTKFIFNYNKTGNLISCDQFIATTEYDFKDTLDNDEKEIFKLLVSDSSNIKYGLTSANFILIKGFRKPKRNEAVQSFPIIKRGYKLKKI